MTSTSLSLHWPSSQRGRSMSPKPTEIAKLLRLFPGLSVKPDRAFGNEDWNSSLCQAYLEAGGTPAGLIDGVPLEVKQVEVATAFLKGENTNARYWREVVTVGDAPLPEPSIDDGETGIQDLLAEDEVHRLQEEFDEWGEAQPVELACFLTKISAVNTQRERSRCERRPARDVWCMTQQGAHKMKTRVGRKLEAALQTGGRAAFRVALVEIALNEMAKLRRREKAASKGKCPTHQLPLWGG